MKFIKKAQIYKASNVTFDPKTKRAYSYHWWCFVKVIKGQVIFNNYRYSNSTSKHQSKVRSLMQQLGIKVDRFVDVRGESGIYGRSTGLNNINSLAELNKQIKLTHDMYVEREIKKRVERNERARVKRLKTKLERYLETQVNFRDYDITERKYFGNPGYAISTKVAFHQVVDSKTLEHDVQNALYSFHRDSFGSVVFYV